MFRPDPEGRAKVRTWFAILIFLGCPMAAPLAQAQETVFVAGATGGTGLEVVRLLDAAGYNVRGGTRNPDSAQERHGSIAAWVRYDALDTTLVDAAVAGVDRIVSTLGGRGLTGPGAPQFIEYLAVRNLTEAAIRHNVKQFVLLGAANTGPFEDYALAPRTGFLLYWKTKGEEFLKASGVPYTIVGASGLRNAPREGPGVRLLPRAEYEWPGFVSRFRVAEVMAAALTEPDALNTAFALIWDEDVPPGEMAGAFAELQKPETGPRRYEMPRRRW